METGDRWLAVSLDEVERIDWRRIGLTWLPLRFALQTEIVGIAVFIGDHAGDLVVEPHIEDADGRGHQEVYVVMRGEARFLINGEEAQAPAGTFLRVDPAAHRQATAVTDGTVVLALGNEPTFEVSASERIERLRPHIRTDRAKAEEIVNDLRSRLPGDRAIDVAKAMMAVGRGDDDQARAIVGGLVSEDAAIRAVLEADPDLSGLLPPV